MADHKSITRTVNGETDRRLIVRHPLPLARTISAGSNWNQIRFIMRLCTRRKTSWTSAPKLYIGMSSGATALPGTSTPNHFYGVSSISNWGASGSITYFATSGAGAQQICYQNGVASTAAFTTNSGESWNAGHMDANRQMFGIEFIKGSPWTVKVFGTSYTANMTLTDFKNAIDSTLATPPGMALRASGTFTIDEATYGALDTFCFAFIHNSEDNCFEVSDIDYAVLA